MEEILSTVQSEVFGVWFLIGAALVFWMQAGFAMVEAGFTRAKNTGNILMKNLMDFCIESRGLTFLQIMQILTGPISYLTLCSVQLLLPSYLVLWLKEQDSFPTVSTQQ